MIKNIHQLLTAYLKSQTSAIGEYIEIDDIQVEVVEGERVYRLAMSDCNNTTVTTTDLMIYLANQNAAPQNAR